MFFALTNSMKLSLCLHIGHFEPEGLCSPAHPANCRFDVCLAPNFKIGNSKCLVRRLVSTAFEIKFLAIVRQSNLGFRLHVLYQEREITVTYATVW